jgi:DNA-binding response OmpR family regulator
MVVDDEQSMVEIIRYALEKAGYEVFEAHNGEEALAIARRERPDLVVLDIMLPGVDGYVVCKILSTEIGMPIIMLTARDEEIDKVVGLELGADDYLTKPFSPRELVARVRAHLRRTRKAHRDPASEELAFGDLVVGLSRREVFLEGKKVELTPREFDLLVYMINNKDRALTRELLLDHIWGYDFYGDARIVNVTVARLREKIERDPANPQYVVTVRGVGYMFAGQGRAADQPGRSLAAASGQ